MRTGGTVTAAYTWLADGTKLGVRNGSGSDGFEYVGSLIYRKSGGSLQLSEALFGDGVIRLNDNGTQEVNYFLTDHLGSVRVIVDGAGTVKECNDYYPFGARHIRSDYAQSTNRWKYNGKELQTTGELGYLDYGARMYDAGLGRWFCADPEAESRFVLTPYHYCSNNPLLLVDKDGKWDTHYIDQYNNVILQTDDGSDDVVRVPAERMSEFLSVLKASRWDPARLNSRGWNDYWKGEFGLADIQFSAEELFALDMFNSKWSRNAAAAYLLKPTLENAFKMGFSEGLSQWTNPELVVTGLNAGIVGLQSVAGRMVKGGTEVFKFESEASKHMSTSARRVPVQILNEVIKNTKGIPDPRGSKALMYYSTMIKNGKTYKLEILYDKASNSIWHFKYTRKALGPLPIIQ